MTPPVPPSAQPARWWHALDDGRLQCDLCPRFCVLNDGKRGFCFVRQRQDDEMALTTYGRSSGFCIDPIEKKPLNHFHPGTSVLSFGTAGCNLGCQFCQNHDISKSREMDALMDMATPEMIAKAAVKHGAHSVAFTYNDPIVFAEYAIDTAAACRARGVHTVAVSDGYITDEARPEFFAAMDATNIDLKAFTEHFYRKTCKAELQPVLDTLVYLRHATDVWFEITTLLIPGENDAAADLKAMSEWLMSELGPDVPIHFSAFHPDYRMLDTAATPSATLRRARDIASAAGLRHVYTGNVHDRDGDTTRCASCGTELIVRDWYQILSYRLTPQGACPSCATPVPGRFDTEAGAFGRRRVPVRLGS